MDQDWDDMGATLVAFIVEIPVTNKCNHLDNGNSHSQAKLYAILRTLIQVLNHFEHMSCDVITDSIIPSLMALASCRNDKPLNIKQIYRGGARVHFFWTKGHRSYLGNTVADSLAVDATTCRHQVVEKKNKECRFAFVSDYKLKKKILP